MYFQCWLGQYFQDFRREGRKTGHGQYNHEKSCSLIVEVFYHLPSQYSPMKRGPCCWNSSWSMDVLLLTLFAPRLTITKHIWIILMHAVFLVLYILAIFLFSLLSFVITEDTKLIAFNFVQYKISRHTWPKFPAGIKLHPISLYNI